MAAVVGFEFRDDDLHEIRASTPASALLNVEELPHDVTRRSPRDRRHVANAHQVWPMTRGTGRRLALHDLAVDDLRSTERDEVLAAGEAPLRNVRDESRVRVAG
jgi:hypothetical protein